MSFGCAFPMSPDISYLATEAQVYWLCYGLIRVSFFGLPKCRSLPSGYGVTADPPNYTV